MCASIHYLRLVALPALVVPLMLQAAQVTSIATAALQALAAVAVASTSGCCGLAPCQQAAVLALAAGVTALAVLC
jgi:hypothetical protein